MHSLWAEKIPEPVKGDFLMDERTNKDILGRNSRYRAPEKKKGGRPKVNRDLVIRNLKAKDASGGPRYTKAQIARMMNCTPKTITRIYNEAIKSGDLKTSDFEKKAIGIIEADFDSECLRAKGLSFLAWLETRFSDQSSANYYFNFNALIWEKIFDKCDLTILADQTHHLADQMAIKFVTEFQGNKTQMRSRLKKIRFLFRFLGRGDINDKHLKMDNSKHPRAVRRVQQISSTNFPLIYNKIEDRIRALLGNDAVLDLRLKIVTQMRTGTKKSEREFYGMCKGTETKSYLTMVNDEEYQFHIFAKKSEEWDVIWMPKTVREGLFERYQTLNDGDHLASTPMQKLRDTWGDVTEEILGRRLILHDTRKISITWLYVMEVPLEVATMLNVGWKSMDTAHAHYIDISKVLRKSFRAEYRKNIPDWFKEGLDDFTGFGAFIGESQRPGNYGGGGFPGGSR